MAYKLRKYNTKHNRQGDPCNAGFAIAVPAAVGRKFPDGQMFEFREGPAGALIFEPVQRDNDED